MKLLNARINHATNSSSSHSVILAGTSNVEDANQDEFGWEMFCLKTYGEKMNYMASQMFMQLNSQVGEGIARETVASIFGAHKSEGFVDHQSELTVPKDLKGNLSVDFFKELAHSLALDSSAHIRGGNDNEDWESSQLGEDNSRWGWLKSITEQTRDRLVARKQNGVWTVYNRKTGVKMHLDLGQDNIVQKTYRPETPELVDMKITDYCPYGCSWCYQDSTVKGKHGDFDKIRSMLWSLGNAEVLEIALGGGEPTMHPRFTDILESIKEQGITPNFTTKSIAWYKKPKIVEAVKKNVGAIAHSVTDADEVKQVYKVYQAVNDLSGGYDEQLPPLTFQYILDAEPMKNFIEVVEAISKSYGCSLTLLGYKETGRGGKRPHNNKGWLELLKALKHYPTLSIDTLLASQYEDELKESGITEKLYYKEEGRFSLYIDAVEDKFAKSSFVNPSEYQKMGHTSTALTAFKEWGFAS